MKYTVLLFASLLLASCSTTTATKQEKENIAPASVAGRIVEMDGTGAESCSSVHGAQKWSEWQEEEFPCVFAYNFDESNRFHITFNPTEKAHLTYEKVGPASAVIRNVGAPNHGTYTLDFDSPTEGTATNSGTAYGRDYMTRKIKFTIR